MQSAACAGGWQQHAVRPAGLMATGIGAAVDALPSAPIAQLLQSTFRTFHF
jgi:hypothetical protein